MRQAPLGHDRAAARHDAGDARRGEMDVAEPHPGMDGEIVDALLGLLDQRVLVDLEVELDRIAVHLLERLIDRHRADRHRRIPDDPLAREVDVLACREIHDGVGAPADRPHHLLHLLLDGRSDGRVADIGVDLGEEVPADDHRLRFWVVDIGGDDGAPACDFRAHELRRHEGGKRRAETHPIGKLRLGFRVLTLPSDVLAVGDIGHLLGDDAGPCQFELRHWPAAPRFDPRRAQMRQTALHIDFGRLVRVRARGVVDAESIFLVYRFAA